MTFAVVSARRARGGRARAHEPVREVGRRQARDRYPLNSFRMTTLTPFGSGVWFVMKVNLNVRSSGGRFGRDAHIARSLPVIFTVVLAGAPAGCLSDSPAAAGDGGHITITGDGGLPEDGGSDGMFSGPGCGTTLYEPSMTAFGYLAGVGNLAVDELALYWIDAYGKLIRTPKGGAIRSHWRRR